MFINFSIICNFRDKFVFLQTRLCCCSGRVGWGTSAAHPDHYLHSCCSPCTLHSLFTCLRIFVRYTTVVVWGCIGKCIFNVDVPLKSIQLLWLHIFLWRHKLLKHPCKLPAQSCFPLLLNRSCSNSGSLTSQTLCACSLMLLRSLASSQYPGPENAQENASV